MGLRQEGSIRSSGEHMFISENRYLVCGAGERRAKLSMAVGHGICESDEEYGINDNVEAKVDG